MNKTNTAKRKILYVDDDRDDCNLLAESFAESNTSTTLICAPGGEEAITYLNSVSNDGLPSLIILDLNMPKWNGRRTLSYIKSQPTFAKIPVVILSTSDNIAEREICKQLGAVSYLQKPYIYEGYKDIVRNCLPLLNVS